jgi:hypothetical protein
MVMGNNPRFISSNELLALLGKRQLVDQNTHRVVIDIKAGQLPRIYTESYGDPALFVELITDMQITDDPALPTVAPVDYNTAVATEAKDESTHEH